MFLLFRCLSSISRGFLLFVNLWVGGSGNKGHLVFLDFLLLPFYISGLSLSDREPGGSRQQTPIRHGLTRLAEASVGMVEWSKT